MFRRHTCDAMHTLDCVAKLEITKQLPVIFYENRKQLLVLLLINPFCFFFAGLSQAMAMAVLKSKFEIPAIFGTM